MMCLYVTGNDWDHYLVFAMTEINSGMYQSTLGDITFPYKILYADPSSEMVEGEAQQVFSRNYESCSVFVGPAWTTQLSAIGEWAGMEQKPIVSGGATSTVFAEDNFGYTSRSIPSETNVLKSYIQLIVDYGLTLINIVYVNNEYGSSLAEALVGMSNGRFEVQLLRTFDDADDINGINSAIDDLEKSPSGVTFLALSSLETKDFLNVAGKRGMHESQLWLSPKAGQVADQLEPPSTGGIWGIFYGEELTEESPFAQRYLAKDPAPHVDAQQYGLGDDYDTLTYWGAYAYDAVLVAAHGLSAATNRSNGEEVLKEIRALTLTNTTTGILQLDENGDRKLARIPVFYITPEATAEQFALYNNGTLDFLQDPLWPGGSTSQPTNLIKDDNSNMAGKIAGGILAGLVVVLATVFTIHSRRSKKIIQNQHKTLIQSQEKIDELADELQVLHSQITPGLDIGTTKHADALEIVDTLLHNKSLENETENLLLVKQVLIRGNDDSMYIPQNINPDDEFIMKEFAGMINKSNRRMAFISGQSSRKYRGPSTRNFNAINRATTTTAAVLGEFTTDCLGEFKKLDITKQTELCELLSFSNLKRWDFNVFDVAAIDQENTLLFVSWAVICSPFAQMAMIAELKRVGVSINRRRSSINEAGSSDEFPGYDFSDLNLPIDDTKLISFIRLIQDGYEDNPYHNRIHAADVVQTLHSFLQMAWDQFTFDKEDIFLLLISAVVHDVKHPGRNNAFQVNSFSDIALEYNDISVLENKHVSYAFQCMFKEENHSRFIKTDLTKLHAIRGKIIEAVLHTDMSKHFATVSKIKAEAAGKSWDEIEDRVRWEVLIFILHMADISNPAKDDPMFKLWTDRCLDEFFEQGDKERAMGVPISPNCDRNTVRRHDSQIGFIKFVVKPAYEVLGDILPAVKENILPVIENNLKYWEEQKQLDQNCSSAV